MYKRAVFHILLKRIQEPRRFVQVVAGPRQAGKTTIARQVMEAVSIPVHFATADEPTLRDRTWITQQWEIARLKINRFTIYIKRVTVDEICERQKN